MPYKHGNYANIIASQAQLPPVGATTLPVYVGTAPVQQLASTTGKINSIILVNSFEEAKAALGYSDDWALYSLCEAMWAHFKSPLGSIGPIVLVNVLDPDTHNAAGTPEVFGSAAEQTPLVNNKAYMTSKDVILSSVSAVDGAAGAMVLGTDYTVTYQSDGRVLFTLVDTETTLPITVSFDEIAAVTSTDVIGEYDAATGDRSGIYLIDLVEQETGLPPILLSAPGWNATAAVRNALVTKVQNINGHFDATAVTDLDASAATPTIDDAVDWKDTNTYSSIFEKTGWPLVKSSDGKVFHMSTIIIVTKQKTDYGRDNVPSASPSNRQIDAVALVLADGTTVLKYDETQANTLNAAGITTAVYRGGVFRLWGPHNSNYVYGQDIDAKDLFDCSIMMAQHLKNQFYLRYLKDVDYPFDRRKVDTIINDAQIWLDSLVADGHLLYAKVQFLPKDNDTASLVAGDFTFDVQHTSTPPGKSITFNIQYTDDGLDTITGGEA